MYVCMFSVHLHTNWWQTYPQLMVFRGRLPVMERRRSRSSRRGLGDVDEVVEFVALGGNFRPEDEIPSEVRSRSLRYHKLEVRS